MTRDQINKARRLAVKRYKGGTLTANEQALVNRAVHEMSPENFYMDGELFADYAGYN